MTRILKSASQVSRRFKRCESGVAAVELALVTPALLTLIFGVIIYSFYFCAYMGVRMAASEGARAAVMGLNVDERSSLATARANKVLDAYASLLGTTGRLPINARTDPDNNKLFRVTVTYNLSGSPLKSYGLLLPIPDQIVSEVTVSNGSY